MGTEVIQNLIQTLSCEFVMATPDEPEGLSGLLPILKQLHGKCTRMQLKDQADNILAARKLIHALTDRTDDPERQMAVLGDIISSLSTSMEKIPDRETDDTEAPVSGENPENAVSPLNAIEEGLDRLTGLTGSFCQGDVQSVRDIRDTLNSLAELSENLEEITFHKVAAACKSFVDNVDARTIRNIRPMEECLVLLKSILRHLRRGKVFMFDYSNELEALQHKFEAPQEMPAAEPMHKKPEQKTRSSGVTSEAEPARISADDMEILTDFVSESFENLDIIEIKLMDLEQDPANTDIINDIFRPFHTIKGVSGFLSLTRINILAHATENLLDGARSGDFMIDHRATDAILESVDTLKMMIERVQHSIRTGVWQADSDIDTEGLVDRLRDLSASLAKGGKEPLGEILIRKKAVDKKSVDKALLEQRTRPGKRIGELLIEDENLDPGLVADALMEQNHVQKAVDTQVKVSTRKLDDLVDYAGEMVIAQAMLRQKASSDPALNQSVSHLGQIVTHMQNIAMSMRMIPIKATFMKMIRLVRDLSRKSGKEVSLQMSGEDTEIDRNVVDALYEPMVHMIRNSVDHGIESPDLRQEQGKPRQGKIHLKAYHKGGQIIIEIKDDGRGLDREKILEKAVSKGLITGQEQMTDARIYNLILEPGFSTAEKVTDVSGRGVGMDVVKQGIERFRGHLDIASEKGKGTVFTISLPLTLAIIDGMLVGVDDEKYVIPTTAVQKAFKPGDNDYFTVEAKGEMVRDRGSLIPLVRLNDIFNSGTRKKPVQDGLVVVVESKDEKQGIFIDELLGKDEYVIKSLGNALKDIKGIAGGAVLSDGRVGLILDIHGIFSIASEG